MKKGFVSTDIMFLKGDSNQALSQVIFQKKKKTVATKTKSVCCLVAWARGKKIKKQIKTNTDRLVNREASGLSFDFPMESNDQVCFVLFFFFFLVFAFFLFVFSSSFVSFVLGSTFLIKKNSTFWGRKTASFTAVQFHTMNKFWIRFMDIPDLCIRFAAPHLIPPFFYLALRIGRSSYGNFPAQSHCYLFSR